MYAEDIGFCRVVCRGAVVVDVVDQARKIGSIEAPGGQTFGTASNLRHADGLRLTAAILDGDRALEGIGQCGSAGDAERSAKAGCGRRSAQTDGALDHDAAVLARCAVSGRSSGGEAGGEAQAGVIDGVDEATDGVGITGGAGEPGGDDIAFDGAVGIQCADSNPAAAPAMAALRKSPNATADPLCARSRNTSSPPLEALLV